MNCQLVSVDESCLLSVLTHHLGGKTDIHHDAVRVERIPSGELLPTDELLLSYDHTISPGSTDSYWQRHAKSPAHCLMCFRLDEDKKVDPLLRCEVANCKVSRHLSCLPADPFVDAATARRTRFLCSTHFFAAQDATPSMRVSSPAPLQQAGIMITRREWIHQQLQQHTATLINTRRGHVDAGASDKETTATAAPAVSLPAPCSSARRISMASLCTPPRPQAPTSQREHPGSVAGELVGSNSAHHSGEEQRALQQWHHHIRSLLANCPPKLWSGLNRGALFEQDTALNLKIASMAVSKWKFYVSNGQVPLQHRSNCKRLERGIKMKSSFVSFCCHHDAVVSPTLCSAGIRQS